MKRKQLNRKKVEPTKAQERRFAKANPIASMQVGELLEMVRGLCGEQSTEQFCISLDADGVGQLFHSDMRPCTFRDGQIAVWEDLEDMRVMLAEWENTHPKVVSVHEIFRIVERADFANAEDKEKVLQYIHRKEDEDDGEDKDE